MPTASPPTNPFASPSGDSSNVNDENPTTSIGMRTAAIVIMVCGAIYLLAAIGTMPLAIVVYRSVSAETDRYSQPSFYLDSAISGLVYALAFSLIGSLLLYAGWSMRKAKNYWICLLGAAVGCLPLPMVFLTIIPSIWSLWKLTRPQVRLQFVSKR